MSSSEQLPIGAYRDKEGVLRDAWNGNPWVVICDDCMEATCVCEQDNDEPPAEPEHCIDCGHLETRCVCGEGEYEAWNAYAADWEAA